MRSLPPAARLAIAKLIRLLASNVDGEVLAAVRALGRALKTQDCDFHDLASIIVEAPATSDRAGAGSRDHFDDDDDDEELSWQDMVDACTDQFDRFSAKEKQFLETMRRWCGTPTPKQHDWLVALFERVREAA